MVDSSMVAQAVPDRDQELSEIAECAETAISQARGLGADSCEVSASMHFGLDVNVRLGEVETLEYSRDRGMGISVYINDSKGHASSGDLRPESIRSCVEKAIDIARFTQADSCNGLVPADVSRQIFQILICGIHSRWTRMPRWSERLSVNRQVWIIRILPIRMVHQRRPVLV